MQRKHQIVYRNKSSLWALELPRLSVRRSQFEVRLLVWHGGEKVKRWEVDGFKYTANERRRAVAVLQLNFQQTTKTGIRNSTSIVKWDSCGGGKSEITKVTSENQQEIRGARSDYCLSWTNFVLHNSKGKGKENVNIVHISPYSIYINYSKFTFLGHIKICKQNV